MIRLRIREPGSPSERTRSWLLSSFLQPWKNSPPMGARRPILPAGRMICPAYSVRITRQVSSSALKKNETVVVLPDGQESSGIDAAPEVLVERILNGDAGAEADLVRRYSRSIMTMLKHRTRDVQRAEDVHQETFYIVLKRLRSTSIDDPSRISSFLHRTAINVLIGEHRREARRKTDVDTDLIQRQMDATADQLRQLIRDEADHAVRAAIQELTTPRDRELLYRFYILQEDKSAVCKALSLTSAHFDRVVSRARKRFRQLIEQKRLRVTEARTLHDE